MAEEAEGKVSGRRRKEPLKPGHTLADWGRLCATGKITNGLGGLQHKVTPTELASHNKPDDAWIVFNGRVYNITPYLAFHPGGASILLKVAGKDATRLFNATHQWVNGESLLRTCVVGPLVSENLSQQPTPTTEIDTTATDGKEKEATRQQQEPTNDASNGEEESIDTSFPAPDGPQVAKAPSSSLS